MQYMSTNIFSDFEFHDAYFQLESFENNTLTISAQYLNIHKNTEQNPCHTDMEVETAQITFHNFQVLSFEPGRAWKRGKNGELYTDEPQIIFEGKTAEEKLLNELRAGTTILDFGTLEHGNHYLDGIGHEPLFQAQFLFDSAMIQWDAFCKPAWYENKK